MFCFKIKSLAVVQRILGCETLILTEALIKKPEIFTRTGYRIMICIKQSRDHVKNNSLYQLIGQITHSVTIREHQLKFTGHFICMFTDEPNNRFVIYKSKIKSSLPPSASKKNI